MLDAPLTTPTDMTQTSPPSRLNGAGGSSNDYDGRGGIRASNKDGHRDGGGGDSVAPTLGDQLGKVYQLYDWHNEKEARREAAAKTKREEEERREEEAMSSRITRATTKDQMRSGRRLHEMAARREQRLEAARNAAALKAITAKPKITSQAKELKRQGAISARLYKAAEKRQKRQEESVQMADRTARPPSYTQTPTSHAHIESLYNDGANVDLKRKLAVYFQHASTVCKSDVSQHLEGARKSASIAENLPQTSADRLGINGDVTNKQSVTEFAARHQDSFQVTPREVIFVLRWSSSCLERLIPCRARQHEFALTHDHPLRTQPRLYTSEHKPADPSNNVDGATPVTQASVARRHDKLYTQAVEQRQRQVCT